MRTESSSRDQEPSSGNGIPESGLASMTGLANPGFAFTAEEPKVVVIRAVESGSREVGKSLKIGKNRKKSEKSEKSDLISY